MLLTQNLHKNSTLKPRGQVVTALQKDRKIVLIMGSDKNQLQLTIHYCEINIKMIIFKLILIGFKQNLGIECSNFYFRWVKIIFFNKFNILKKNFGSGSGVDLNPLALM